MVYSETYKILDCGTKKSVPKPNMPETKEFSSECMRKNSRSKRTKTFNETTMEYDWDEVPNENYEEAPPIIQYALKRIEQDIGMYFQLGRRWTGKVQEERFFHYVEDPEIVYEYLNIRPFEPWVMLNISPKWKNKKISRSNICQLKRAFESYLKEEWYSEWKYVCEAGGNGDHLHLHAVCKMNKDRNIKSVRTHLSKHWKRQIIKHWKDVGGSGGSVENPGMQAIIIQGSEGEQILKDKIDYLDEEKKPIGHKNKTPKTLEGVLGVLIEGSL